eukprot:c27476_g1_i1.p1 GENE.c27476_g1_i1~~c27476_g1_i1.p1  ORF type:complete len:242 (+),score=69.23 c27476_g1_i1:11-736(+)
MIGQPIRKLEQLYPREKLKSFLDAPLQNEKLGPSFVVCCAQLSNILEREMMKEGDEELIKQKVFSLPESQPLINSLQEFAGQSVLVEHVIKKTDLSHVFPDIYELFKHSNNNDDDEDDDSNSIHEDLDWNEYLKELTAMSQVISMCDHLENDLKTRKSHKYVPHQIALLYSFIRKLGAYEFRIIKIEIETKFEDITTICSSSNPVLTDSLKEWIIKLCETIRKHIKTHTEKNIQHFKHFIS